MINADEYKKTAPGRRKALTAKRRARLIGAAVAARDNAYAPYSRYKVGAALLGENGKIYTGCNFENAAFGAGTCAERVALGAAIADGTRKFIALAVAGADNTVTPCGICRQALWEFGDIPVLCTSPEGDPAEVKEYRLKKLLPEGFGPEQL